MPDRPRNVGASMRQRLLNLAHARGQPMAPGVEDNDLPVLLDMPSPHAYPPNTVIAEKFHAMVALGRANSRMKDYYDVWMLIESFELEPQRMRRAIEATFGRRNTEIPATVPRRAERGVFRRRRQTAAVGCLRQNPQWTNSRP